MSCFLLKLFSINFVHNYTNSLLLFVLFSFSRLFSGRCATWLSRTAPFLYHWGCCSSRLSSHSVVEDFLLEEVQIKGWNGIQLPVHVKSVTSLRFFRFWLDKSDLLLLLLLMLLLLLLLLKLTVATSVRIRSRD